jgi:hypothetical protein
MSRNARTARSNNPKSTPRTMGMTGVECFDELVALDADGDEDALRSPRLESEVEEESEKVREAGVEVELVRWVVEAVVLVLVSDVPLLELVVVLDESVGVSVVCGKIELRKDIPSPINELKSCLTTRVAVGTGVI